MPQFKSVDPKGLDTYFTALRSEVGVVPSPTLKQGTRVALTFPLFGLETTGLGLEMQPFINEMAMLTANE